MDSVTTYREPEFDDLGRLVVGGFDLRYALTATLVAEGRPMSVTQLISRLNSCGLTPRGRASKSISDALYREIGKGRAAKVRRAVYRADRVPKATLSRIQSHVRQLEVLTSSTSRRQSERPAA